MDIEIKHCNNLDLAKISLMENKLNIKFAPNGSGKSSIAKALLLSRSENPNQLDELLPFKFRKDNPEKKRPEVTGAEIIKTIMCFNEEYVSGFVFKQNELVSNSFDIFIRTETYKQNELEIEELISDIKQLFSGNPELESLINTLNELADAFKLTKTGLSKSTSGMKGLSAGNKIQHIPLGLELYKPFIQSQKTVKWIDWQTTGCDFSELSDTCPFCTSDAADKKEQILKVGQEYDKNTVKCLVSIISVIEKLGDYFSPAAQGKLQTITTMKEELAREHEQFLVFVKTQLDTFIGKLEALRALSAFQFKKDEKVAEKLPAYKLDLEFFSELNSPRMRDAITPINHSIDKLLAQAGHLQGKINKQRSEMNSTVQKHQKEINGFLEFAGYQYIVEIAGEGERAQLRLRHSDHVEHLSGGSQHLSFGEKNAFAIVLFMYECLAKKPDLVILDDPISSFDKNKKYAILEMLFRRETSMCLKNKTVLMLTHDVEPIIDTTKSLSQKFYNQTFASFLQLKEGCLTESKITKSDILTFSQICKNALATEADDIVKLIYVRRHLEIVRDNENAYEVASNLLHRRERAFDSREPKDQNGNHPEMNSEKFKQGCVEISNELKNFSYVDYLKRAKDDELLKELYFAAKNGYEKLQIFRILDLNVDNSVIQKFVNETYHIENEFICQLDPVKFDTIPGYVVSECTRILQTV